jgi:hypothetical protein
MSPDRLWGPSNLLYAIMGTGGSFIHSQALIVQDGPLASLFGVYWSHTHTHTQTHGRTPLDEWSAGRRDLYLHRTTQHIDTSDKYQCPERDSNPRPQQQSGRRQRLRLRGHWDRPGGPFPGGKARPERDAVHSPHLVSRSRMSRSYISSPPAPPYVCCGTSLH